MSRKVKLPFPAAPANRWDLFCGISCAGTGVEQAFKLLGLHGGFSIGINHKENAVATSKQNHPEHEFKRMSVQDPDAHPSKLFGGRKALFGWGSPSCRTHSAAKGGVPIDKEDRVGPEEILEWMRVTDTDVVIVENVPEFRQWTHLIPKRDKRTGKFVFQRKIGKRKVTTTDVPIPQGNMDFVFWCSLLAQEGYEVCLVQDKTRLGELFNQWLDAARAMGYDAEAKVFVAADYGDATTRKRLFIQFAKRDRGFKIVWPKPTHAQPGPDGSVPEGLLPWRTAWDIIDHSNLGKSIFERPKPLAPKTLRRILIGFERFVIRPLLERNDPDILAKHVPFILPQQQGGAPVKSVKDPVSPLTQTGAEALAVVRFKGTSTVESLKAPVSTIEAGGQHHGLMSTNVVKFYGTGTAVGTNRPLDTVTSKSRFGLQTTFVTTIDNQSSVGAPLSAHTPIGAITTKERHAVTHCVVQTAYSGADRSRVRSVKQPIPTVAGTRGDSAIVSYKMKALEGSGEVILELNGLAPGGKGRPILHVGKYSAEIDILFRMFMVKELAAAQGLPDDYQFVGTKTQAIAGIGNGVPVNMVRALTAAAVSQRPDIIQALRCPAALN